MNIYELRKLAEDAEDKFYNTADELTINENISIRHYRRHRCNHFMEALEALKDTTAKLDAVLMGAISLNNHNEAGELIEHTDKMDSLIAKLEEVDE